MFSISLFRAFFTLPLLAEGTVEKLFLKVMLIAALLTFLSVLVLIGAIYLLLAH